MRKERETLKKYLPINSIDLVLNLMEKYPFHLKIVNERKTKHGDFRQLKPNHYQITINSNLNPYRFLLTLIHEIAHLKTYSENQNIKPHGLEWKRNFQYLMLPFLNPNIYPSEILKLLANYLINPKASTDSDINLSLALKQFDPPNDKNFIFEIPVNGMFIYNQRKFKKVNKRRTRFECVELNSNKKYLFHHNAEVELIG